MAISVLLLLSTVVAKAQQAENDSLNNARGDTTEIEEQQSVPETFDISGTKIQDSTVAFSTDTVLKQSAIPIDSSHHTAVKSVWRSALLPGFGQAYNKKYWKIPIIYAGFGGLGYALYYTSHNFNQARSAYRNVVRNLPGSFQYQGTVYSDAPTLMVLRDTFKKYLTYAAMVTVLWYSLNLVDAAVDGHLYHYNMDDKLSLNFDPSFHIQNDIGLSQACYGLTFTLIPLAGHQK